MQATTTRPNITATADGKGVVSHAGSRLLADIADLTTLTAQLGEAGWVAQAAGLPRSGPVLVKMAVTVADGARTISDVAVLADQAALSGMVASDSTCWRLLDQPDTARLRAVASARAAAREVVWAQRAELTGQPFPPARAAGCVLPGLVVDLDASLVVCHSEKEQAAATFKNSLHQMMIFPVDDPVSRSDGQFGVMVGETERPAIWGKLGTPSAVVVVLVAIWSS